ncbi:hypothetical protein DRJ22_04115 [Candidatus Woesearchaeota archaeon]|nr:MAG: hypothetical protein B6U93_00880 [Candidatus Woesearchaeota archaeon ex4484_78]RLE45550.1 MAG: hypothetical protein DRJ22_04115 [Candidatus Woesearchaeota archaeon]
MKLKLLNKLRKKIHKDIGLIQDMLMSVIYEVFPKAVLHGGTAIWRCYNGTRFSEDIDVYLDKEETKKINAFKEKILKNKMEINKFKKTKNTIYSKISFKGIEVRFEASLTNTKNKEIIIKPYETIEGNYLNVFTLTAEELIKEKAEAYLSRHLIRDLYDIYILTNHVENKNKIKPVIKKLINNYKKPKDESILETLVFIGAVPTSKQIINNLEKWAK